MAGTCRTRPAIIRSLPGSWTFYTAVTLEPTTSITALSPVMNCWRLLPRISNASSVFSPTTTPTTISSLQLSTGLSTVGLLHLRHRRRVFPTTCPTVQSPASMVLGTLLAQPKSMTLSMKSRSLKFATRDAHLQAHP